MNRKKLGIFLLVGLFLLLTLSTGLAAGGRGGSGSNGYRYGGGSTPTDEGSTGGSAGGGSGIRGNQGGPSTDHGGTITLNVEVIFKEETGTIIPDDQEVDVTLYREGIGSTVTTVDGIATFYSEASGDCIIEGSDVPGYITPEPYKVSLTGKNKVINKELEYIHAYIPVTGVELNQDEIKLISGYEETLVATVSPANASNHDVTWSSGNEAIATVENGVVYGVNAGLAVVTVTTIDGGKTGTCTVNVVEITGIGNPEDIDAIKGEIVILPSTVIAALSDGTSAEVDVSWRHNDIELGDYFIVPESYNLSEYSLEGTVLGTELTATLIINVDIAKHAIPVTSVNLDKTEETLIVGESFTLTPTIYPPEATVKNVIWTSSNEAVATVDAKGKVTAVSPGWSLITVLTIDGGHEDYCIVSVLPEAEEVLIFTTDEEEKSEPVTEFPDGAYGDVYVNVENLVQDLANSSTYHVKVEQRGAGSVSMLGYGSVDLSSESVTFNLYDVTEYDPASAFSNEYFVSMSTDPGFPRGEDMTVTTNFKIGLATPTIPEVNIRVTNELVGGNRSPAGIIFILAREMGDASTLTWHDYYNLGANPLCDPDDPYNDGNVPDKETVEPIIDYFHFCDEVKMIGITNQNGLVEWMPPRETLKLGGYVLLQVTPKCYTDNLNMPNPDSHDFTLLKEVHLTRNGSVEVNVITTYQPRD